MKKTLFATTLLCGLLIAGSSFAATANFGGIKLNINTPQQSTTQTAKTSANAEKMKSQIEMLNTKLNSIASVYQTSVTDIANNVLSKDELTKYNKELSKLKTPSVKDLELNIDIAEDGSIAITNALQSNPNTLANLSSGQVKEIQNSFDKLKNVNTTYKDFCSQANQLIASIQKDPMAALSLHSELLGLTKNVNDSAKQVKNISNLMTTLTQAFAKQGITLK